LEFDLDEVRDLKDTYQRAIDYIIEELPPVNWDSRVEVKDFFRDTFHIKLPDLTIAHLSTYLQFYDENTESYSILVGILELYKLKYSIRNYLDCILRHQQDGKVYLRQIGASWVFPNKQPLPKCEEILRCVKKGE